MKKIILLMLVMLIVLSNHQQAKALEIEKVLMIEEIEPFMNNIGNDEY